MSLEAVLRIERLNSEEMLDLRAQFIDFGLNLSHASQLNPQFLVDVIEMVLDFRRDLGALTSGRLALPIRGSGLARGSSVARRPYRPTRTLCSLDASRAGWSLDAAGTGRACRTRRAGNALGSSRPLSLDLRLSLRHGTSIAPSFKNSAGLFN